MISTNECNMLEEEGQMNQHVMAKLDIGHRLLFGKEHVEKPLGVVVVGGAYVTKSSCQV